MDKLRGHLGGEKQFVHLPGASRGCADPSINSEHAFVIQLPLLGSTSCTNTDSKI